MRNRGRTIVSAVFLIIGIVFVVLGLFFWTGAAGGTGFPGMGSAEKEGLLRGGISGSLRTWQQL